MLGPYNNKIPLLQLVFYTYVIILIEISTRTNENIYAARNLFNLLHAITIPPRGGLGQKISVGLKVLYIIGFFFHFDNSVKQQTMYEITTNTTSLAKKEQRQTNKQENFYSKRETNKPN
jgi:hypothetical protein